MGSWGYGALDDDMARDVYETFLEAFKKGAPPDEIHAALITEWLPQVEGSHEEMPFRLGLAKALWECGALSEGEVRELAQMIESDMAVRGYDDAGDQRKRRAALQRFFARVSVPKAKPRRPPVRQPRPVTHLVTPGACLAITVGENLFGGAIMVQINDFEPSKPWYRLALLRRLFDHPPPLSYFKLRDWMILDESQRRREAIERGDDPARWPDRPCAFWCPHRGIKANQSSWSIVGSTTLRCDDPIVPSEMVSGVVSDFDLAIHMFKKRGCKIPLHR